jgi:hypothetical protein
MLPVYQSMGTASILRRTRDWLPKLPHPLHCTLDDDACRVTEQTQRLSAVRLRLSTGTHVGVTVAVRVPLHDVSHGRQLTQPVRCDAGS